MKQYVFTEAEKDNLLNDLELERFRAIHFKNGKGYTQDENRLIESVHRAFLNRICRAFE